MIIKMANRKYHSEPVRKFTLENSSDPEDGQVAGDMDRLLLDVEKKDIDAVEVENDSSTLVIDTEEEVFSLGYIPLDICDKKLKDALQRAKDNKVKFKSIDFGKNGYVTDAVIKKLVEIMGKKKLSRITKVSLEGCSMVTDLGIHWLVQGLSKNKHNIQVNINGCSRIKDGGLATLANASNIGYIEAMATSVSHFSQAGNTKGCPLLVKPELTTKIKKDSYVLIIPVATKHSLSALLSTKIVKERKSFHYLKDVKLLDWNINMAELERNHVLVEHMLPTCPVHVLISFDASSDVQWVKQQVIDTIAHVLSKEHLNPQHIIQRVKVLGQSKCFMGRSLWNKCTLSPAGILRNISGNPNVVGAVVSCQPMSRTNNYFEVQCISCQPETGLILGLTHDVLSIQRFPLESREYSGGVVEGFEMEVGAVYGFGIKGKWESEYVLSNDVTFYYTKNGVELVSKKATNQSCVGMFPIVSVIGASDAAVKLLNHACPPEALIKQWEEREQYWTPTFWNNVLCDDRGILSFVVSDQDDDETTGLMLCQEEITREHNIFTIQVLETAAGIITVGLGPEDYALNKQPGWDLMSIALHGDNGKIYVEAGTGVVPDSGECLVWKNGDMIKAVVSIMGEGETIQLEDMIQVDFYVNTLLMATVKHMMTGGQKGTRLVFMVSLKGAGVKAKVQNYRPVYIPQPPCMDKLTMGRSNFMSIYDDGRLLYRKFDKRDQCGLFLSRTPFNAKLTYFELKVNSLDEGHNACIGFGHREYPANNFLGSLNGSVGYHSGDGLLYCNNSSGNKSSLDKKGKLITVYGNGDTVGCGFDVKHAKIRDDGSLENQQILHFYFTKNGKKVHEVVFEYLSDGIYPGANLNNVEDELVLLNYYPGSESGDQLIEERNEKVTVEQEEKFLEGCRFTLVSVGEKESDSKEKVQNLQELLKDGLEFPMLSVIDTAIQDMENNPNRMNLQGQQLYGQLCWQKECLERFLKNKNRLRFMSVDVSSGQIVEYVTITYFYCAMTARQQKRMLQFHTLETLPEIKQSTTLTQGHQELIEHIVHICEMDLANHSGYYDLQESVHVGLHKLTTTLATEKIMAANQMMDFIGNELGQNGRVFEAAVHHLQTKGSLISIPFKRTVIAMDIIFAETLVHATDSPSDTMSGKCAPCIEEKTQIWNKVTDIFPDLQLIPHSKTELLNHILQFLGVMKIPRFRIHRDDPRFCYCTPATLGDLTVQLSYFLENASEDVVIIQRVYSFLYSDPGNILSIIVSRCLRFFQPLAISQSWSVFQSGAAQTVIYVNEDHGITLVTRCFMPSQRDGQIDEDTKYHVEEYAFNIFCLFIDLIDHIIAKLKVKFIYSEQTPPNLVNSSIGCIHKWGLSSQTYRQTLCTLCGQCCDKGQNCPYNGLGGEYQHQCGCNTRVTGCKDCGICQNCADQFWVIRSYLRPNLEVASYGKFKSNPFIPLNATTYDEVEFTNLGNHQTPICLKVSTGQYSASAAIDNSGSLTKMFPAMATVFPSQQLLQEHMANIGHSSGASRLMKFEQGDTVTIKLDPVKRDTNIVAEVEEESLLEITPVYFTSICRNTKVWHETGIVVYTSPSPASKPVGHFISASPLTPACPSFSFQILNHGQSCNIAIGVCHKRYPSDTVLGWNQGSLAYHANDGRIFTGSYYIFTQAESCMPGDIMKCQLNFEQQSVSFYKNDILMYEEKDISNFGNYHAAIGFYSFGEAIHLLEKEPWQISGNEEPTLPDASDSYSYGNMQISPGKVLTLIKVGEELSAWLMINNPSKNTVGYKIFSPLLAEIIGYLKPSMSAAFRHLVSLKQVEESKMRNELCIDIHWFLLESNRDYSNLEIGQIYLTVTPESLLKHRLKVKITEVQATDSQPLKLSSEEPDTNDHYLAEVFKNGISVQKYWLKGGNYVCCLPQKCNVLVRYPKFPTLRQPNGFQKGMRIVVDLSSTEKDLYAEAVIEEVTEIGDLRLQYSQPGKSVNTSIEVNVTAPEIAMKSIVYDQIQKTSQAKDADSSHAKGSISSDKKYESETVTPMSILSFQPRGSMAATKRAYMFPPFHLLTEASKTAVLSLDSAWKANTLSSVAQCKTLPTRLTVQELQISHLVGSKLDWLAGATSSRKFDLAFAFLPLNLGYKDLCFPTIPSMFTEVSVHRLCFLVDQMYFNIHLAKNYNLVLDAPLHFVNVAPIPPTPILNAEDMFASSFNGWTYSTLYSNKLHLPLCDKIFPAGKPDFSRHELEMLMKSLIHVYAAQCHIFSEQYGGIMFQKTPQNGSQIITASVEYMDKSAVKKTDKAELSSDILIRKKFRNNIYCKAHQWCLSGTNIIMKEEFNFRSELFKPYEETVNLLYREMANVTQIRPDFYTFFPNLQYLKFQGYEQLKELPDGISRCLRLEMVSIKNSAIEVLPADLFHIPCLQRLHCADLKVQALPASIIDCCPITELILANLLLTSVPKELGNLSNLEHLNLNSNPLEMLPMELKSLTRLKKLFLCGIPWIVTAGSKVEMPLDQFEDFLKTNSSLKHYIGKEKLIALFNQFDHNKNSRLDENEIANLNTHLFWKVPRLGASCISCTEYGGIPPVIFLLSSLETLCLDFQAITSVPVHIWRLQNLTVLSISNNPLLESLPGSLGHLPSLKSLRLISNPSLRTPPNEVVSRGITAIKAYMKRLAGGFTECRRTKLMLVGLGGAGKTSLLRSLMSSDKKSAGTKGEDITNGIDILPWTVKTSDNIEVTYNTWDFAGQTLYYNTHQFFLSKRAVYLLLWSTRQGFEHAGLEFWLSSISSHAPKTPIFVVGTHCDQVPKADIPKSELQERYPQIAGFHFVSSIEGIGIVDLEKDLLRVTLELKNMGEKVPKVWLNMEKKILAARTSTSILPWKVIKEFGTEVGIYDEKDIREAIQFLHELGTVQYFDSELLRDQVVINPQWIVNVMSCIVSVKNSPIKEHNGKFYYKHMPDIWRSYPEDLHKWLLWLTEEFDLTFPLPNEEANIVPCLLPHDVPKELDWPVNDVAADIKKTKFTYRFTYLPAGLFNRVQVRLFQFSDGRMIWKRGSLLKKNKHQALILQISDSELQVKVRGPRPENVVFLIHEIIESLIQESFHGVVYELLVPCPDCIVKEGTLDPYMFESSFVRRAREHKAPFLQCKKYFHTISMAQLYEVMPTESGSDIDAQLQSSLITMQQLNSALSTDVATIYSARDKISENDLSKVNPQQIRKDLEEAGLACWYSDTIDKVSVQDIMLTLKNCKVVVALLSDNFEQDEKSRDLLLYTIDTLVKDFIIVVIGESMEWENTDLGMRIGKQEEKVMIRNKSRYEARVGDMISAVKHKLKKSQQQVQQYPNVFISYCWSNSRDAQSRGTKCPPEAIGWGDPREIKLELEKRGLSCWLDLDQPAAGKGLFKNITEGIRNSKVLVAFVSDEYVKSDNCMMELRFAIFNMNIPIIVAVVGRGKEWKNSEVGILMQRSKAEKVNFQEENTKSLDVLETYIKQKLPQNPDHHTTKLMVKQAVKSLQEAERSKMQNKLSEVPDNSVLREEYELMQRKFMRHIISFVSSMDSVPTPRLIVVDFEKHVLSTGKAEVQNSIADTENQVRHQASQSSLRPKSATQSFKVMKIALEDGEGKWENEAFCLKVLCEDEKGWHVCEKLFPMKMNDDFKNLVKGCSAYLARMYAILRQSAVKLNCFDGPQGLKFTSWVEQNAPDNVSFIDSYKTLRTKLVENDKAQEFLSQLRRCHLPTGKIYWLCDKHSSGPRITHLSTEVTTRSEIGQVLYEEDVKLKEKLEHSEAYEQKKKAKSPSSGIILPKIMDVLPNESLVSEDSQALFTALTLQNPRNTSIEKSDSTYETTATTESSNIQTNKNDGRSKICSVL